MEAPNLSSQTNWTITSGTLHNTLTFQSSLSFSDEEESTESHPLLLHSPSPDSTPCQITINFAEKHEVRQIYVRSTARVYEIYTASDLKTNNEYLCTVRCGVATRDGEILRSCCFVNEIGDDNVRSEDDWVEVKVVDGNSQTKPEINLTSNAQDLFEATAEINDVDPCISVTIRLLSLQSKGSVCVDEIYVFGDPVDSEIQETHNENSSSSSLMAMLLPTLMQVSKTTGLSSLNAVRKEKQIVLEDDLKETPHLSGSVIENQMKGKDIITDLHAELNEGPSQPDTLSQAAKMESNCAAVPSQAAQLDSNCRAIPSKIAEVENYHRAVPSQASFNQGDFVGGNVERVLEKLMSRMDRIEEICLGFQEKMIMPMNNIDARLQRVEQQLETLSMKWKNSELPSCHRISAPDASCIESNTNDCENCVDCTVTGEIESDKKSLHTEVLNVSPRDDTPQDRSDSENTTQLLPGLVVAAPEFSEGEDEEDNESEQEINPSNDKGKPSIDDALSSALANFLSSSLSSEFTKYTKSLHVKAPEFTIEDDDHEINNETVKNDSVYPTDSDKLTVKNDSMDPTEGENFIPVQVLDSSTSSLEMGENVKNDPNDKSSKKTALEAEQCDFLCSSQGDQDEVCVDSTLAERSLRMDCNDNIEDDKNSEIAGKERDVFLSEISNIPNEVVDSQNPSDYRFEAPKNTLHDNIIENVLGFSLASNAVDFEISLLDVKFDSQKSPITDGFLESLLDEIPETSSRDPSVKEISEDISIQEQLKGNGNLSIEEHSNLISVDEYEPVNSASNPHFVPVEDLCASIIEPVNIGDDTLAEDHKRKREA
ncbi:hypothetical protein TSUD_269280 [Trifolium subterraneum]|uniref:Uncharacterized protein n=1 Tax=Trifolium subterraneum TaxID=3900 RepID=A0A2Z6MAD5_TRISU|nr:hypothetical protein TSUD_269280 [Trifolium subterraneum]